MAEEQGWTVLAVSLRGCGQSEGQFSMLGWLNDVARAIQNFEIKDPSVYGWWDLPLGGSLAIMAAARDPEIREWR